jgi:parallel beta-helix repeat protein
MSGKLFLTTFFITVLIGTLSLSFEVQRVEATGTIYIRADGSIDPPTAPISSVDNVTYTLTGNITCEADGMAIVVQRSNTIIDGNGYTLQGVGSGCGFGLPYDASFVKVEHINIVGFEAGIRLISTSDNIISGNNITNNKYGAYISGSYYNIFYHNNFVNNTYNFEDQSGAPENQIWDDGYLSGGNYWSDYEGVDEKSGPYQNQTGSDGIGDAPIYRSDRYPLMNPWTPPTPTPPTSYVIRVPIDLATIQEAIDVAGIDYPIFVYNGTYYEQLVIRKPLLLIGEQPETTIIDGRGQENVISILSNNVVIQNFTVRNSAYAISGRLCAGICIERPGMPFPFIHNNFLIGNIITDNSGDGIAFYYTSNNTVLENNITNNVRSIFLYGSSNNSISGNNIIANEIGISIQESSFNSISENNVANNGYGIYFSYLTDLNRFYHNNFINNTRQVEFHPQSGYTNFCDNEYPSGGNYWSNYTGTDANHDGIGDTPYIIDANNTDHYPLMTPYIIPEFPIFFILPLFMMATLLAVIVHRKRGIKNRKTSSD